jgi:hypothetical protein
MRNGPSETESLPAHTERDGILNEISTKWSRLSRQELSALETAEDLVDQLVAKYGIEKTAAEREVSTLLRGRYLTA